MVSSCLWVCCGVDSGLLCCIVVVCVLRVWSFWFSDCVLVGSCGFSVVSCDFLLIVGGVAQLPAGRVWVSGFAQFGS